MIKRILPLLLAVSLFLLPVRAENGGLDELRQSVVHLYAVGLDVDGAVVSRWTGTGFAVGTAENESDVFLTNNHVVTGNGQFDSDHMRLWILRDGALLDENHIPKPGCGIECTLLGTTSGYPDVAILRAEEPMHCAPLPLMSSRSVANGMKVYSLGFPGIADSHNGADSGPEDVQITSGTVTNRLAMKKAGSTRSLIHTARIQHGNSGGPLVNANGIVVGQNTYGFEETVSTELFCALYIDYAMELLDELRIPYTRIDGPSPFAVEVMNALHAPNLPEPAVWCILAAAGILVYRFAMYILSKKDKNPVP